MTGRFTEKIMEELLEPCNINCIHQNQHDVIPHGIQIDWAIYHAKRDLTFEQCIRLKEVLSINAMDAFLFHKIDKMINEINKHNTTESLLFNKINKMIIDLQKHNEKLECELNILRNQIPPHILRNTNQPYKTTVEKTMMQLDHDKYYISGYQFFCENKLCEHRSYLHKHYNNLDELNQNKECFKDNEKAFVIINQAIKEHGKCIHATNITFIDANGK